MSDQSKMKDLVSHKEGLEHEVERLERQAGNAKASARWLQERIKKEKLKIKALEEQIEKEKGSWVPEVFDPKSRVDAGRWNDASYGIPDLIKGSGYKGRVPRQRHPPNGSLESVWKCDHPAAKRWCRIALADKMDALKEEIAKTERMYAKYIE